MKRLDRLAASAWFAYGSIVLIQAKVLWGIWAHRDLTPGADATNYFVQASRWTHHFQLDLLWSPLYDLLLGSLRWLVDDPYSSTVLYRVLIVFAATLLVLAVLRRLLTPGIAWALAVWWAILPINYDVLYEVHLFVLLPELIAVLIALTWTGLRMRAGVFAALLAATVLVRNEVAVALVVWTFAWGLYEIRARRRGAGTAARTLALAAGVPVLIIAILSGAMVVSDPVHGDLARRYQDHQELSVCQAYAVGYQQRHDDLGGNPFVVCPRLMKRDFGEPMPSMLAAIRANPAAMGEHYLWNARLVPYGLQLMLFDRISAGGQNRDPDYIPVTTRSTLAVIGSAVVAAFVLGALLLLWRNRRRWWECWLASRACGWLALGALAATAILAALWQRPRPEYLYALSVGILALLGTCAMVYADRWPPLKRARAAIPLAAVLLVLFLPPRFTSSYVTPQVGRPGQPVKEMVDRLHPIRSELRGEDVKFLATFAAAGCAYLGEDEPCRPILWKPILPAVRTGAVAEALARRSVDFIYLDQVELLNPAFRKAAREAESAGWTRDPISAGDSWLLLGRPARAPSPPRPPA